MFEKHKDSLAPKSVFLKRLAMSLAFGICAIAVALFMGMLGYHVFEKMSWIDSFSNASMILSGMGPFGPLKTSAGKIFAGVYALFSGLAFISITAIIFAPVIHRSLHKFHLPDK